MKKTLTAFFALLLLLSVTPHCIASGAAPFALPTEPGISPQWKYIANCDATINIDSSGNAAVFCYASGISGNTTKVVIEAKLQRTQGIFWFTQASFSTENNSIYAAINQNYAVESGYSYRVKVKVTVYSGTTSESATIKSNVVEF